MLTKTPFLAGFSTLLCGRSKRKKQDVLVEQRKGICERSPDGLSKQLNSEISPELLSSQSATQRDRIYPNAVTFWAFLAQMETMVRLVARIGAFVIIYKAPTAEALPIQAPALPNTPSGLDTATADLGNEVTLLLDSEGVILEANSAEQRLLKQSTAELKVLSLT